MSYIGNSPGNASQRVITRKVATAGQTRFASDSGYATGYVDVIVNGADLVAGVDFNETGDGINIDLVEACEVDDSVKIIAWIPRGLSDGYTKPEANALLALKADLVAGKIPSSQLPAYVDDVLEYANLAAFPATGSSGIIYVAQDTNNCYRWSGSAYIVLTDLSSYYTKTQSDARYPIQDSATGALQLPSGTTAQRPTTPLVGMQRMNTTTGYMEYYRDGGWQAISGPYYVEFLTIAGGGGGGRGYGGGGGAGGYITGSALVSVLQQYTVTVGAGGGIPNDGVQAVGGSGTASSISTLMSAVGGGGGGYYEDGNGISGGSGGGGGGSNTGTTSGGLGTSGQGYSGGTGTGASPIWGGGGGGGGSGANGSNGSASVGGNGGAGTTWSDGITRAGGGGGGVGQSGGSTSGLTRGNGGSGGGGYGAVSTVTGIAGTTNTGSGGGGAGGNGNGATSFGGNPGNGGSGIVIIRYAGSQRGTGGTVTSSGGYTYHTFTSSGTFTA